MRSEETSSALQLCYPRPINYQQSGQTFHSNAWIHKYTKYLHHNNGHFLGSDALAGLYTLHLGGATLLPECM